MTDILVVCTANVARSPLFAARLQLEADRRLGSGVVHVGSAGTDALYGQPAATDSVTVARQWGLDLNDHVSRGLPYVELDDQTLVVVMTEAHRRSVLRAAAGLGDRTFLLRDLVVRLDGVDLDALPPPSTTAPEARIDAVPQLVAGERPGWWRRRSLNVPDPISQDLPAFEQLGEEFVEAGEVLGTALFGPVPPASTTDDP